MYHLLSFSEDRAVQANLFGSHLKPGKQPAAGDTFRVSVSSASNGLSVYKPGSNATG